MKRVFSLMALAIVLLSLTATAQVPRTSLVELHSATW